MSDDKPKYPRAAALEAARDLLRYLAPLCERIVVAGSLRRRRQEVGDIELVYIPRIISWADPDDLFGRTQPTNVVFHALELMLRGGVIAKRLNKDGAPAWGESNRLAVHASGIPVDFFATSAPCWWNYLVCRTGGAQTNTAIASAARERGWQWHPTGSGFSRLAGPDKGRTHAVRSEEEVFEFVGMEYRPPEDRA